MRSLNLTNVRSLALALTALAAVGCNSTTVEVTATSQVIEELTFAASLGIDLATFEKLPSSGIYMKDLVVGTGARVNAQSFVKSTYKAWLANGTLVYDGERTWQLGNFEQPLGYEYGIQHAYEGGVRKLIVPPALAWGDYGSGDGRVPPGAVVIFEITLVEVRSID